MGIPFNVQSICVGGEEGEGERERRGEGGGRREKGEEEGGERGERKDPVQSTCCEFHAFCFSSSAMGRVHAKCSVYVSGEVEFVCSPA